MDWVQVQGFWERETEKRGKGRGCRQTRKTIHHGALWMVKENLRYAEDAEGIFEGDWSSIMGVRNALDLCS